MMSTRVAICLALAFFFFGGAHGAKVTFMNKCPYTVWPGTLAVGSNRQLSKTGFELSSGQSTSLGVPAPWMGQFWARTGCSTKSGKFICQTADCGSGQLACKGKGAARPATLAELQVAANSGTDSYAIENFSKGFNVPISIAPQGGTGDCKPSSCPANINAACPQKLQQKGPHGKVVGCKSACLAFNDPKYCCTGDFKSAEKCLPTQYSRLFKKQCPEAYSYAFDDKSSKKCSKGPNYSITFCP